MGDGGSSKWIPPKPKQSMGDGGSSKWIPPKPKQSMDDGGSSKWKPPPSKQELVLLEDIDNINWQEDSTALHACMSLPEDHLTWITTSSIASKFIGVWW
jgi:hypothetical protein